MKLPDEYDDNQGMNPTVMTALIAVVLFVAFVVIFILSGDSGNKTRKNSADSTSVSFLPGVVEEESSAVSTGKLTPEDLDFWDMFAESTASESSVPTESATAPEPEADPSTDGKHTLVRYADGSEEWVLISPYLPKHGFDFTKMVCQSNLMKYYVNGKQASYVGIDISQKQDTVDYGRLKKAGIQFVMIRIGARAYGSGLLAVDESFQENMEKAADAGLDVGVYFSSQAVTEDEAREEANLVIENLTEYKITYPVAFDMEFAVNDTARIDKLTRSQKTSIAKAFLETIEAAGYKTMLYGNKEWLIKEIDMSKLTEYDVWLSQLQDLPDYPYRFTMWQYMDGVEIDGINGPLSLNISFVDYREK